MSNKPHISFDSGLLNKYRSALGANLPDGWELTTLGEAFKWGSGGTPKRTETKYYDGKIPWLIIGDMNDGVVTKSQTNITEEGLKNSSAKWIEPGSVLLAMYGSIGKLGISGTRLTTNQAIAFTNPAPFNEKYLFYYLMFVRDKLASLGKGATQKNISQTVIKAFPFIAAPQDQQHKVVAEIEKQFSRLDEAVTSLKRAKASLKRYKAAVLKAAVEGKLTEEWRKQHPDVEPASELLKRILSERRRKWEEAELAKMRIKGKDSMGANWRESYIETDAPKIDNLPSLPYGWAWTSMGKIFDVFIGSTPSRKNINYWNGDIPWVSSGEVAFCRIKSTTETITDIGLKESSTTKHPIGTILLGMIGEGKTRGQAAILDIEACNNQNSAAIRVSETVVLPEYIYIFLEYQYKKTRQLGSGGNQPALNKRRVQNIMFPLPPVEEQKIITSEVESMISITKAIDELIEVNLHRTENLRREILRKAFAGNLFSKENRKKNLKTIESGMWQSR